MKEHRRFSQRVRKLLSTTKLGQGLDPSIIAQSIKEVGPESTVLSSDLGQVGNPDPVEGFQSYAESMLNCGTSEEALDLMLCENPSRLPHI